MIAVRRAAVLLALLHAAPAIGAVPRGLPPVAEIVTVKGDEQVRFVEEPAWRVADLKQDLLTGDTLQTGRYGGLALLFRDETQIRVHRNSTLVVKNVRARTGTGETLLRLDRGAAWSRARARPDNLRMETPAVTAAIRGTDWHLKVEDDGRSTLIVLAGEVAFFNDLGAVTVVRGEIAVAEVGQPPTKSILLNPKDRPQWELVLTPDWIRILALTGLPVWDLRAVRDRLRDALARERTAAALIELAEVTYELGDAIAARELLGEGRDHPDAQRPDLRTRVRLLEGLLAAHATRFDEAERALLEVLPRLDGRRRLVALLGRSGILLAQGRYVAAEAVLAGLEPEYEDYPDLHLSRILLASFRGEQDKAVDLARASQARFPEDTRFSAWLAHLYLLLDEPERMRETIETALGLDPEQEILWHLKGTYHHFVVPDTVAALAAYRRALAINANYAPTWNNLALALIDLGDYDGARTAIARALRLAPADALYKVTLAGLLGVVLDRLDEGEERVREALAIDPAHSGALLTMGSLALKRGRSDEAVDWMLRATVANPGLAGANTALGVAYYQAGEFRAAEQALDNALRLDPHDPAPALIGSAFAQDQAEAGRAVRLAREALDRYLRYPTFAVETLGESRSGILNLGSAYSNLGLRDWGEYHGQLSFAPHWASSHFFLATQYASASARRSEALQGLLLDPLAVSARNRYFDVVRRPFHDFTLGVSLGSEDGAFTNGETGTVQGLVRIPFPLSYFANVQRTHSDGYRVNTETTSESVTLALGVKPEASHDLLLTLAGSRAHAGLPGSTERPDRDDRLRTESVNGALGYHYRAGARNDVLARVSAAYGHDRFRNDDAFGDRLSDRSASLIRAFGEDRTRQLYREGLCDGTGAFSLGRPVFVSGSPCQEFGLPMLPSDLPDTIDLNSLRSLDSEQISLLGQARHLFEMGPVRVSHGAEWTLGWRRSVAHAGVLEPLGTGDALLVDPAPPFPVTSFPFGTPVARRDRTALQGQAGAGHLAGEWAALPVLRLDAGLFVSHFDDGDRTRTTQLDPRAGLAWQVTPRHWFRLAGQRNLVLPFDAALAPVATVGLAPRDEFTVPGGSLTAYEVRWDAEWSSRIFTFAGAEERRIHRFVAPVPQSLAVLAAEEGRLRSVTVGVNAWVGEQWGLLVRHRWTTSANLSDDEHRGNDLPLVPRRTLDAGITWVHPWQLRIAAFVTYVGDRAADTGNTGRLSGYWTTSLAASWQLDQKRWALSLLAQNLLDARYQLARGVPAPGPSVSVSAEYRF